MRITKEISKEVAKKMLEPARIKVTNLKESFIEQCKSEIFEKLPDLVKECISKHPDFIRKNTIYLTYDNGHLDYISYYKGNNESSYFPISKKAKGLYDKWQETNDLYKQAIGETENTLYMLKTYKRITEQFPEALKYLPSDVNSIPAIDINSTRNLIKSLL